MKIYSIIFILSVILFTGCATTQYKQLPPEKVVVTEIQEKVVVKPCPVPDLSKVCDFKGDFFTPTEKLLQCIIAQKRALELCKNIKE